MPDGFNWDSAGPPVQTDDDEGDAARASGHFARNKQWVRPGVTDFHTKLNPEDEKRFQSWVRDNKVPFEDDGPQSNYDMRGFWKTSQDKAAWKQLQKDGSIDPDMEPAGTKIDPNDGKPHYPDWWKTPFHETFSDQSQFALHGAAPRWNDKDQLVAADGTVLFDDKAQKPQEQPPPGAPPTPAAQQAATQPAVNWDSVGTAVPDHATAAPAATAPPPTAASIPTEHIYPIPPSPLAGMTNRLSDAVVKGTKEGWGTGENPETIAANKKAEQDFPNAAPIIKGVNWLADNAGRPFSAAFGGVLGGIEQAGNELGVQGAGREAAGILTSEMGGGAARLHGEVPPDSGIRMGFDPNAPPPGEPAAPPGPSPGTAPGAGPRPGGAAAELDEMAAEFRRQHGYDPRTEDPPKPSSPGPTAPGAPPETPTGPTPAGGPRVEPTATPTSAAPAEPAPVGPQRGDPITVQNADGTEGVGTFFGRHPDGKVWVKRGDGQPELYERDPTTDRLRPVPREAPPEPTTVETKPEAEQPDTPVATADAKRGNRVTFTDEDGDTRTGTLTGIHPKNGKYVVDMGVGTHLFVEPKDVVSVRTAPEKPATPQPATDTDFANAPNGPWEPVGQNEDGQTVYRNPQGVHAVNENGVPWTEATQDGKPVATDEARKPTFKIVEPTPEQPVTKTEAPEQTTEEPAQEPAQEAAQEPKTEAESATSPAIPLPPGVPASGTAPPEQKDETKPKPKAAAAPAAPKGRAVYSGSGRTDQKSVYNPMSAGIPIAGEGKYWAFTEDDAKTYGPNVETGTLDLKNPLVITSDDEWRALTKRAGWKFPNPTGMPKEQVAAETKRMKEIITGDGHDGVVFDWDDSGAGDRDEKTGNWIKLLRDAVGHPQAVDYRPAKAAPAATAAPPPTPAAPAPTATTPKAKPPGAVMPPGDDYYPPVHAKEQLWSKSGREMSPVPNFTVDTNRAQNIGRRKLNDWLVSEAKKEVAATGDTYLADTVKGWDGKNFPPADRDHAIDILWGGDGPGPEHRTAPKPASVESTPAPAAPKPKATNADVTLVPPGSKSFTSDDIGTKVRPTAASGLDPIKNAGTISHVQAGSRGPMISVNGGPHFAASDFERVPKPAAPPRNPEVDRLAQHYGVPTEVAADPFAGHTKRPDGRLNPQIGDKVYQTVGGFGGTPAHIYGDVYGSSTKPRVRVTGNAAAFGSAPTGKTYPLDGNWTVVGDPEIKRRNAARDKQEADRKAAYEAEIAAHNAERDTAAKERGTLDPTTVKLGDVIEQPDGTKQVIGQIGDDGTLFVTDFDDLDSGPRSIGDMRGVRKIDEPPPEGAQIEDTDRSGLGNWKQRIAGQWVPVDWDDEKRAYVPVEGTAAPTAPPAAAKRPVSQSEYGALVTTAQATASMFDMNQRDPKTEREKLDRLRQNRDDAQAALDAVEPPPKTPDAAHDDAVALRQYQEGGEPTPDPGNAYNGFSPPGIGAVQGHDSAGHEWGGTGHAMVRIDASKGFPAMLKRSMARTSVKHRPRLPVEAIGRLVNRSGIDTPIAWKRNVTTIGDKTYTVGQLPDGTPVVINKDNFDMVARAAGPGGSFATVAPNKTDKLHSSPEPIHIRNAAGETVGILMPMKLLRRTAMIWATGQVPDAGGKPAAPPAPKPPEPPQPSAAPPAPLVESTPNLYRPVLRPAHGGGVPSGVKWDYVEAPTMDGLANRPDLPKSQHRYGVIKTDRPLTPAEIKHFDLEPVGPAAPVITGTPFGPFPDWATKHEPDVGGRVIYADPEVALMEGYSILSGQPVYIGVSSGGLRTKVDIDSFTGTFLAPAQLDRLKAAKADAVDADRIAHAAHPDGPFATGQTIAHSRLIKPSVAALAAEWLGMLGIDNHRVFIADPRDVTGDAGDAYHLNGPYAAIRSAGVDRTEGGSMRRMSNGDYYIALAPRARMSATLETLAHEIGHIVEREMWMGAPLDVRDAVQAAFKQFLTDTKGQDAPEYVKNLRAHTLGKLTAGKVGTGRAEDLGHYWRSFSEWFADQVSRWATTDGTARTTTDQMFAKIGAAQKRLAESATGGRYLPADQMRQWLNSKAALTDGPPVAEDAAPAVADDEAAPADATEPAGGEDQAPPPVPAAPPAAPPPVAEPQQHESWAPEIQVEGKWSGNGLRFATKEEAETSARDLYSRWMMAKDHRAVESTDPVNYRWDSQTGLQPVETAPIPPDQEADDGVQDTVRPGDAGTGAEDVPGTGPVGQDGGPPPSQVGGGASNAPGPAGVRTKRPVRPAADGSGAGGGGDSQGDPDRVPDTTGPGPTGTTGRHGGPKGENYTIQPGALAESRGPMEKARDNLAAIELAQQIDAEKRPATQAEQAVLAKYVGWGGLSGAFPHPETKLFGKGLEDIGRRLKELLTPESYDEANNSTQYAHYTAEHVIRSMWDAVQQLGFKGGSVFEPGMGIGHFLGLMPPHLAAGSQYRGIERDHATAQIARLLYPRSGVKQADFTDMPLAEDAFDLVIGNPPFSDTVIKSDPKYAPRGFALHDYFFAKSLDAVRPGGLLAFITSAGTMNKMGDKARKFLAERAEFLGGVRLPSSAFKQNANTGVSADILFFQRRPEGRVVLEALPDWTQTVIRTMPNRDGEMVEDHVNQWFTDRPETVLGEEGFFDKLVKGGDRYAVRPRPGSDLPTELAAALSTILPTDVMTEPPSPQDRAALDFDATQRKDGTFYVGNDGRLMRYSRGAGHPVMLRGKQGGTFTKEDTDIIRGLIPVRDALRDVFRGDLARDDAVSGPARVALNKAYDAFTKQFGPINKADRTYVKPTLGQIEEARLAAREEARSIDDYWNDGDFDPSAMIASKASITAIAKARQFARDTAIAAGMPFNEGSFDPADVPDVMREKLPNIRPFMGDPESYRLRSIEKYDDNAGTGKKRDIFHHNILTFEEEPEINSVEDGVLWSMNKLGRFDVDAIAEKMGKPRSEIIEALGDKVFPVPKADDTYQPAEEYLSGDVVTKLEEAKKAARLDPDLFDRNVTALQAALPPPYAPSEIRINIGMPWIPAPYIRDFIQDHLGLGATHVAFVPEAGAWSVSQGTGSGGGKRRKYSWEKEKTTAGTAQWGTADRTAFELVSDALNRAQPRIYRTDPNDRKKQIFDSVATQTAVDKVEDIKQAFRDWVAADVKRGDELADIFNDNLNRTVLRKFDGAYLKTPGIAAHWRWRPHQTRVIARIIQVGNTYMAHAVGAGKTSAMIAAGMEMRRLGLVKKPMYVVPNHMLGQFAKEFYEQYPTARIMVADERNFHTDTRKQFVSDVATSDVDAVIITHSSFGHIPISGEFQDHMIAEEVETMLDAISQLDESRDRITVKKLRNRIEKLRQKLSGAGGSKKDQTFTFEEMGIDFLFVDEAHMFRKLSFATKLGNLKGIAPDGSNMAWDLYTKVRYLETQRPGRSLVMASGTPITNTMGELYTLSRYMQPQMLAKNGVVHFDSWVQTFADTKNKLEQTPAGDYAPQTRLATFMNMPTLYKMVADVMDIVTSNELDQYVTRPKLKGDSNTGNNQRRLHMAPRTEALDAYQADLKQRVAAIRARKGPPAKGDDILLSVINDGRHAAIDPRFVMQTQNDPQSKLNMMIDNVAQIYRDTTDHQFYFPANDYAEKAFRGPATQMIFANLGVNPRGPMTFSGYTWIKASLIRQGIPANEIAIIGDYDSHLKRQSLFNDMNEGKVRILIGSVQKMGTGVNAQRRLVAVHNQDPLWFPADDEQRNGRMLRQGNMNAEVQIHDYSTKGTYDAVMWDMMGRKGRFIEQFFRGDPNLMEMEDLGEAGMFEQAAGMATTDERVLELTEMQQELDKQERRSMGFEREQYQVRQKINQAESQVRYYNDLVAKTEQDIARRLDTRGDKFRMTVNGVPFTVRKEATEALVAAVEDAKDGMALGSNRTVGSIGGFPLVWEKDSQGGYSAFLRGARAYSVSREPNSAVASAEDILRNLEDRMASNRTYARDNEAEADAYRPQLERKFELGDQINELRAKVRALEAILKGEAKAAEEQASPAPDDHADDAEPEDDAAD